jgi:molybdate transport system substrate-binding protein
MAWAPSSSPEARSNSLQQISEIVPVQGVELVGPLPADLQLTTVFATAIGADAKEQGAAKSSSSFWRRPPLRR